VGKTLFAATFKTFRQVDPFGHGEILVPAEVTAEVKTFSIVFVIERSGFIYRRAANGILVQCFRLIHIQVFLFNA
jgi:hypothetical protein